MSCYDRDAGQLSAVQGSNCRRLFLLWRFGYLGNLFLAGSLLRWKAHLYLLLCFEAFVLQINN